MKRDIWYEVTSEGTIIRHAENDGYTFVRKGPERESKVVNYKDFKDDKRLLAAIKSFEEKTGQIFRWEENYV